jgi:hypothetical protein
VSRIDQWPRGTSLAVSVPYSATKGQGLWNFLTLAPVTTADSPTLTARVFADDGAVEPATISGANAVSLTWQSGNQRWAGELPYISAFDALTTARVRVVVTISGTASRPMDTTVTFTTAVGR